MPCPREQVFKALTTQEGLAGWWSTLVSSVESEVGGKVRVPVAGGTQTYVLRVESLVPYRYIEWHALEGADEWKDTTLRFHLEEVDHHTVVRFCHEGWQNETPFFAMCNSEWGHLLYDSLPRYLARGKGFPIA